ncbi:HNH endonuclease [Candidatus Saccharibacteria bacterium]|nr:HNH endonuclease [Candidatus Saccharibacteria bacterium]
MNKSENWENERYIFEKLKQTKIFKYWKKTQFDCQVGRCAWCGKPMQYRYTETDHVTPLYYGGKSDASNLVLCHHNCNKNKSTASGFKRPEWIKKNSYDEAVTRKYNSLLADLMVENKTIKEERNYTVDPYSSGKNNKSKDDGILNNVLYVLKYLALAAFFLFLAFLIPKIMMSGNSQKSGSNYSTPSGSSSSKEQPVIETEDGTRKAFAQTVVAEYSNYYNNRVVKGYDLPQDATNCDSWNGCNLSFPLGGVKTPDGYTYSINTLESGVVFSQNGVIPHATKNNVALYKRARCGSNGSVVGGAVEKNAAAVVQLSDGSYYCTQN